MNLIPKKNDRTIYNYYCTFHSQGKWGLDQNTDFVAVTNMAVVARDRINSKFLFGENGVLTAHSKKIRGDILALLDDGWDVPVGTVHNEENCNLFGSMCLDAGKFPEYALLVPKDRLKAISDRVKAMGYAGLGLWVPANHFGEDCTKPKETRLKEAREFWEDKGRLCAYADVKYLKVDWGYHGRDVQYRMIVTEAVKKYSPNTQMEHAIGIWGEPYDPEPEVQKTDAFLDFMKLAKETFGISDVYRTYDVLLELSTATTLMRVSKLVDINVSAGEGLAGVVNIEDDPIAAAALGMSMGIMRHKDGTCYEDVEKALIWQRLAPPFAFDPSAITYSDMLLCDSMYFDGDPDIWPYVGQKTIRQYAPATMSRNAELAAVESRDETGEVPFVLTSKNLVTGAYTIAAVTRTIEERGKCIPLARVSTEGASADAPVGIFGKFAELNIGFDRDITSSRIYAQNLLADTAEDITSKVEISGNTLKLSGDCIMQMGISSGEDTECTPAFLIVIG